MHGTYVFRSVTYIPRTRKQGTDRISMEPPEGAFQHCFSRSIYTASGASGGAAVMLKKCFFLEVILEIGYT